MKHCFLLLILYLVSITAFAQAKYTISGYVREKGSSESLIGVSIYLPGTATGTVTNNYGFYSG